MNPSLQSYSARRWYAAVQAKMQNGMSRDQAMLAVDRDDPKLRQAFLADVNAGRMNRYGLLRSSR